MRYLAISSTILLSAAATAAALSPVGGPGSPVNVMPRNYTDAEGTILQGFLSLPNHDADEGGNDNHAHEEKVPALIVLHDASGPDMYEQQRASIFASQYGYVGFAADIFGLLTEKPAEDASWFERRPFLEQFTGNATLFVQRIQAAIDYVQNLDEVDEKKVAIVGYCMGGTGVVHYLNHHNELGLEEDMLIKGAISIHPSLSADGPGPTGTISIPSLFLTGGKDFLTGPDAMEKLESDLKGASGETKTKWESVRYAKIDHAFSNWFSDRYDARADARSTHSMMTFLEKEFDMSDYETESPPDADVVAVDYADGDHELQGYVSMPEDDLKENTKLPVVIIIPHKINESGPDEYEQQRATDIVTDTGFMTFVADIYSHDLMDTPVDELENMYHTNYTTYQTRIQAAVDHVKTMDHADPTKIAVIGFGFGGSGALYYGLWDGMDGAVKAVASLHGEMDKIADSTAHLAVTAAQSEGAASWGSGGASWNTENGGDESNEAGGTSSWSAGSSENGASAWGGTESVEAREGGNDRRRHLDSIGKPQILIQSGAEDDDMSHVIQVEKVFIDMNVNYELTRFSNAEKKFTVWNDGQYDARATERSMDQLYTVLEEVFDTKLSPAHAKDDHQDGHGHSKGDDMEKSPELAGADPVSSSAAAKSAHLVLSASAIIGILILQLQ